VLNYKALPASGVIADSLAWLNWTKENLLKPAKRCGLKPMLQQAC
jgi:hypothetical protein